MNFIKTAIDGVYIIEPKVFEDGRGYFFESYNKAEFEKTACIMILCRTTSPSRVTAWCAACIFKRHGGAGQAGSRAGGDGFRRGGGFAPRIADFRTACGGGAFCRKPADADDSARFRAWFSVLSETAVFTYKCDNFYNKAAEGGVRFDDPALGIDWKIDMSKANLSDKDKVLPLLEEAEICF